MSKTTNYSFTLADGSTLVTKENINTPITEIDDAIKTLETRVSALENSDNKSAMGAYTEVANDSYYKRWSILIGLQGGGQGIIQGGLANSNPDRKGYFAYKMADTVYTALEGKYCNFSGSGTVNIKERNTEYLVSYGRGQGGEGFDEFTDFGHMIVGKAASPLSAVSAPPPTFSSVITSPRPSFKSSDGTEKQGTWTAPANCKKIRFYYYTATNSYWAVFSCTPGKTYTIIRHNWTNERSEGTAVRLDSVDIYKRSHTDSRGWTIHITVYYSDEINNMTAERSLDM